eukprot:COSAG02_NODE_2884_length_7815_cov_95.201503_4_plen_386_part_00
MWATLGAALLQWAAVVVLALCDSGVAAVVKQAGLADACFRLALLAGGPLTLLLHLTSPYYTLAPSWLEPAFHRWRVSRYFRVGSGTHSQSRKVEQEHSARPYHELALPPCGCIVRWEYRANPKSTKPKAARMKLRVVSWNLEFGYLLPPIIAELRRLQPDVLCIQEVDVHSDTARRVSVDVGREIAKALGMCGVWAGHHRYTNDNGDGGLWGCAVLSKFDIVDADFVELACLDGYPRGAVMTSVNCGDSLGDVCVVSMHTEVCCTCSLNISSLQSISRLQMISSHNERPVRDQTFFCRGRYARNAPHTASRRGTTSVRCKELRGITSYHHSRRYEHDRRAICVAALAHPLSYGEPSKVMSVFASPQCMLVRVGLDFDRTRLLQHR